MARIRLDLHVHSCTSVDSLSQPRKLLEQARAKGLDGIAVCDHNDANGSFRVAEANTDQEFIVIPGAEYSTDAGHIQGLFLERQIPLKGTLSFPWMEVVAAIHEQGGLAVLAHPFRTYRQVPPAAFSALDGMEVYNGRATFSRFDRPNQKALAFFKKNKAEFGLLATAGSDAHWLAEVGSTYAVYPEPSQRSLAAIRHSLLAGPLEIVGLGSLPIMDALTNFVKTVKGKRYHGFPKDLVRLGLNSLRTIQVLPRYRPEKFIF